MAHLPAEHLEVRAARPARRAVKPFGVTILAIGGLLWTIRNFDARLKLIREGDLWSILGGLVFRRMKNGTLIVSTAPDFSQRQPGKRQRNHWQGFRVATADAKGAQSQPFYMGLPTVLLRFSFASGSLLLRSAASGGIL
jgi:hypothetical protein